MVAEHNRSKETVNKFKKMSGIKIDAVTKKKYDTCRGHTYATQVITKHP